MTSESGMLRFFHDYSAAVKNGETPRWVVAWRESDVKDGYVKPVAIGRIGEPEPATQTIRIALPKP